MICDASIQTFMIYDLPAGGRRFMQRAHGYRARIFSGEVTMENDEPTGAYPGRSWSIDSGPAGLTHDILTLVRT